jgi:hypothetical protein
MKAKKRLKRVFIDIEYKGEQDLVKTLDALKERILSGMESSQERLVHHPYTTTPFLCAHKQWYVNKIHTYTETGGKEETIFTVKSLL